MEVDFFSVDGLVEPFPMIAMRKKGMVAKCQPLSGKLMRCVSTVLLDRPKVVQTQCSPALRQQPKTGGRS